MVKGYIDGKRILAVDDEPDVLETLEALLPMCDIEKASTYQDASLKLENQYFDIAILDIMGVRGYDLLEIARKKNIITVMLTAHALSPDNLMKSYEGGAVSYVPKDHMVDLPDLLSHILAYLQKGRDSLWHYWLGKTETYFANTFGPDWKDKFKVVGGD